MSKGVNYMVDRDNYGATALIMARKKGQARFAELLLSVQPHLHNTAYNYGLSPLATALTYKHETVVNLLLSKGANACGEVSHFRSNKRIFETLVYWLTSMAIILSQELGFFHHLDTSSIIDLYQLT